MTSLLPLLLLAGLLVIGALIDIECRRLPNWLTASVAVLYGIHVAVSPVPVDWLSAFLVAGVVFALGFACFAFNLMGGGDVKLMAALALWAGVHHIGDFLVVTALAGGLLSIVTLIGRRLAASPMLLLAGPLRETVVRLLPMPARPAGDPADAASTTVDDHASIPYGVAIAAGGIVVIYALMQT